MPAGRPARRRSWRTVLRARWGSRHRESLSALGMTSAQKNAPISPSLRCLCAMRKLLPPVSCHEAARRPAGLREDAPGEQYCERAGAAGTVRTCLHLACHQRKRMRPSLPRSSASARCASCSRWSAATRPRAGRPAQNTRIADGATHEPGACCKSCYPRSTSTTRCTASCCQNCQLKFNRRGATSR